MKFSTVVMAAASLFAAGVVNAAPALNGEVDTLGYTPIGVSEKLLPLAKLFVLINFSSLGSPCSQE